MQATPIATPRKKPPTAATTIIMTIVITITIVPRGGDWDHQRRPLSASARKKGQERPLGDHAAPTRPRTERALLWIM
jgi:hypothetical protein